MASHQTLSPPPASSSKKHKVIDVTVDASLAGGAASAATSSKKKSSKKRKAIDVTVDASLAGGAASAATSSKKKSSKKRKAIDVTVDASLAGGAASAAAPIIGYFPTGYDPINVTVDASLAGGAASAAAPVIGYFPTGYDPLAATEPPRARLFRHEKHASRVELVVGAPGGGPDFVGRSYAGEAAAPQLCGYALGVLDKASGTLKIVPITANKILRLEPHFEVPQPAHSQHSEAEAGLTAANTELNIQDLTQAYGAKKDKAADNKWRSLNEQKKDSSAYLNLDLGKSKTTADDTDSQASTIIRNIPPYDPVADTPEKAYLFDEIIPKNIRPYLLEIVGHLESGEFPSKGYGKFVSNRVNNLQELQGEDKEKLAWILSYITHLLSLLARNSSMFKRHRKENQVSHGPGVPPAVQRQLLNLFTEEGSSGLSTEKNELLISYILVLTLYADDFRSDPTDICMDLKMTRQMIRPYYDQLGCKIVSTGAFKPFVMTLPTPLKFQQAVRRRRRQR